MTSYRPYYTDKNSVAVLETPFPTMLEAWRRCQHIIHMGLAQIGSVRVRSSHGTDYTLAAVEKILADNEIPLD